MKHIYYNFDLNKKNMGPDNNSLINYKNNFTTYYFL